MPRGRRQGAEPFNYILYYILYILPYILYIILYYIIIKLYYIILYHARYSSICLHARILIQSTVVKRWLQDTPASHDESWLQTNFHLNLIKVTHGSPNIPQEGHNLGTPRFFSIFLLYSKGTQGACMSVHSMTSLPKTTWVQLHLVERVSLPWYPAVQTKITSKKHGIVFFLCP